MQAELPHLALQLKSKWCETICSSHNFLLQHTYTACMYLLWFNITSLQSTKCVQINLSVSNNTPCEWTEDWIFYVILKASPADNTVQTCPAAIRPFEV